MATLKRYNGSSWDTIDVGQPHYIGSLSTVAGNASSGSYLSVRWYVSGVAGITTPYDGMKILVKIPLAGVGTAGVMLSINGNNANDYHPLAYNVNSVLTTHFPVNSIKMFTYDANQSMTCYKTSNTATTVTGVWKADSNYDSNTTITYGTLAYYLRPYMKEALYRYKLVMFDNDNRLVPLTTTNNSATAYADWSSSTNYAKDVVAHRSGKWYKSLQASNKNHAPESNASWWTEVNDKTPTSSSFRPDKIYWYNTTTTISAGAVIGGNALMSVGYNQPYLAYCNFNKGLLAYRLVYLCGTYNRTTGLFTLNGGGTAGSDAYYVQVPTNTANLTLSSYFTSGKDYILVGGTYSSNNYFHLREDHPLYHFDGTNLVPYDTYNENRIECLIPTVPTKTSDLTNDSGFLTGITSSQVTTALGYTPYNSTNPNGYITSSALSNYVPTTRTINSKALSSDISLTHADIGAGNLTLGDGANYMLYRTHESYRAGYYYHTTGDESVVFANKYNKAGWIFAVTDPTSRTNWQSLTPTLQIKDGGVAINKLIGQGVTPTYKLDVNGSANATSIYENGTDISTKYYLASNPNGYTSNTGTVIGSSLTADYFTLGNGTVNIKISSYKPANSLSSWSTTSDVYLPTMKAISNYVSGSYVSTSSANYIKTASVSGNTLTLTKGNNTTVTFTPSGGGSVNNIKYQTGYVSLEDYVYFQYGGSGKIIISGEQGVSSGWNFNLECNATYCVGGCVYAEMIISDGDVVCVNYCSEDGTWYNEIWTSSWDSLDTWRIGTFIGYGTLNLTYIGNFTAL